MRGNLILNLHLKREMDYSKEWWNQEGKSLELNHLIPAHEEGLCKIPLVVPVM